MKVDQHGHPVKEIEVDIEEMGVSYGTVKRYACIICGVLMDESMVKDADAPTPA